MKRRPLTVYLDSSDYSALSKQSISAEYAQCLKELKGFSEKGTVVFAFSCSIVSEMLPINREHLPSARSRLSLMNELCRCALPDSSEVMRIEVVNALKLRKSSGNLLIKKYGWMPTLAYKNKPKIKLKFPIGANKSKFYSAVKRLSSEYGYPIKLSELALAISIGAISNEDASLAAVYESRDIEFLLSVIDSRFGFSSIIAKSIRDPSSKLYENVKQAAIEFASLDATKTDWSERLESNLVEVIKNISKSIDSASCNEFTLASVNSFCPGLVTAILSSYSSMIESFRERNPRKPKPSDFADAIHALYAPYVDFFRADKYMSLHIKNSCPRKSVHIVNDLLELPSMIRSQITNTL